MAGSHHFFLITLWPLCLCIALWLLGPGTACHFTHFTFSMSEKEVLSFSAQGDHCLKQGSVRYAV